MDLSWCSWCKKQVVNLLDHVIEDHGESIGIPTEWPDGVPVEPIDFSDIKKFLK